jgi:hypothetical protein
MEVLGWATFSNYSANRNRPWMRTGGLITAAGRPTVSPPTIEVSERPK